MAGQRPRAGGSELGSAQHSSGQGGGGSKIWLQTASPAGQPWPQLEHLFSGLELLLKSRECVPEQAAVAECPKQPGQKESHRGRGQSQKRRRGHQRRDSQGPFGDGWMNAMALDKTAPLFSGAALPLGNCLPPKVNLPQPFSLLEKSRQVSSSSGVPWDRKALPNASPLVLFLWFYLSSVLFYRQPNVFLLLKLCIS